MRSESEDCRVYSQEPVVSIAQIVGQNAYDGTKIVMLELPRTNGTVEHIGFTMDVALSVADKMLARCMSYQAEESRK